MLLILFTHQNKLLYQKNTKIINMNDSTCVLINYYKLNIEAP